MNSLLLTTERVVTTFVIAMLALCINACRTHPTVDPRYLGVESLMETIAVLRRHIPDDTYRFEPALDFRGKNVYRASLERLENIERIHRESLQASTFDDVIAFSKGRALERLRAFDLAAVAYAKSASRAGDLREKALRSQAICEALHEAKMMQIHLENADDTNLHILPPKKALSQIETRVALLNALQIEADGTHYEAIVREEIERADMERAQYFSALRFILPNGSLRAISELQRVSVQHRDSKYAATHLLNLANLYSALAREYLAKHPPEGLLFDPPIFAELVQSAVRIYQAVASQDGRTEKIEAARMQESILALSLRVDRSRLQPQ